MTRWLRDDAPVPYRWVSVATIDPGAIEEDQLDAREWPGGQCTREMSPDACRRYDPRTDHFSSRNYVAYRADRFALVESGALEIPLSATRERRFATWARLREVASGLELIAASVHLDAFSGAHRLAAAHRLAQLVRRLAPTPVLLLGDFNAVPTARDECECSCGNRGDCACASEHLAACAGQSVHQVLTEGTPPLLVDTLRDERGGSVIELALEQGAQPWRMREPCWPRALPGEGRLHLPSVAIRRVPRRVDYIFATPSVTVLESALVDPVERSMEVNGQIRRVHASDHLPVRAALRVGGGSDSEALVLPAGVTVGTSRAPVLP